MNRNAVEIRSTSAAPFGSNTLRLAQAVPTSARPAVAHQVSASQASRHVDRAPVETVPLQAILKGAREAIIDFDGAAYRLRITRNHRLILTK